MCGPGGYIADRFGAAKITLLSTFIGGVLTAIIPLCAMMNVWMVIVIRFLTGFTGVKKHLRQKYDNAKYLFRGLFILLYIH